MANFIKHVSLWQRDIALLVILNLSILSQLVGLSDITGFVFLVFFPGVIIQRLIAFKAEHVWERILHTVGLSISFVIMCGLVVNTILPIVGIVHPLSILPVLFSFDVILLLLIAVNGYLKRETRIFFEGVTFQSVFSRTTPHIFFIILPLLAVAGATILNNGGSNIVSSFSICLIAITFLFLVTSGEPRHEGLVVSGLYFSSLALLLISSMRSFHVIGWDVNAELQVFRMTQSALWWSMSHFQDAYNACLSITLLPTIFSVFVRVSDEYIFKFIFQLIFALMPISTYFLVRGLVNSRIGIISGLMVAGNVVFSHGMPALVRQEFGFLYFGLMLLVMFSSNIKGIPRTVLLCIYGASIIVSHYSTTYITVFLLALTYTLNLLLFVAKRRFPSKFPGSVSHAISVWFVIFLAAGTIWWGVFLTGTSNNISGFIDHSRSNIAETFTYDTWSRAYKQLFTAYPHYANLEEYKKNDTIQFRKLHPDFVYYDDSVTKLETLVPLAFAKSPAIFGQRIQKISQQSFQLLKLFLNNLLVVCGSILLVYFWFVLKFNSSEFVIFSVCGFVAFGLILLLPDALEQYNIDRLFFQLLMTWSMLSVIAGRFFLSYFSSRIQYFLLGSIYVILFLFYTSVVFSITGGATLVSLNNYGTDYEKFYVQDSETSAAQWLGRNVGKSPIFANSAGYLRLRSHGGITPDQIFITTLPSMLDKDSYVFLTRMNVVAGISTYLYYNEEYPYTAPLDFLNSNKNAIYDSGTSKIFR